MDRIIVIAVSQGIAIGCLLALVRVVIKYPPVRRQYDT